MHPQDVAARSSCFCGFEAFESQPANLGGCQYLSSVSSVMIPVGGVSAAQFSFMRQSGENPPGLQVTDNRRSRCRTSSKSCCRCAALPTWPRAPHRKKNLWWSSLSRSAKSRFTPGNTSKGQPFTQADRAVSPDLTRRDAGHGERPC